MVLGHGEAAPFVIGSAASSHGLSISQPVPSYPYGHVHVHEPVVPPIVPPLIQYTCPSLPSLPGVDDAVHGSAWHSVVSVSVPRRHDREPESV
jgi:hypothetical protein